MSGYSLLESVTSATNFTEDIVTSNVTQVGVRDEGQETLNVADAAFDREIRIFVLYIEVITGTLGGLFVCLWLWSSRKRKKRLNRIIFHVALSDLLVILLASLPQLILEYDREWRAGALLCKLQRYTTSFVMMASNNMLVLLSADRYFAIMYPLQSNPKVRHVLLSFF